MVKCQTCGKKEAYYGYEYKKPLVCDVCRVEGMRDVKRTRCEICLENLPSFGFKGQTATRCSDCKSVGMTDTRSKKCEGCRKVGASYGLVKGKATHCGTCRTELMWKVCAKLCEGCNKKTASFGFEHKKPKFCGSCKQPGMKNVVSNMCIVCQERQPSYGLENGIATHCPCCKTDSLVNLKYNFCVVCLEVCASFGIEEGKPTHCGSCRHETTMFNVISRMCQECNVVRATFGLEGGVATHCGGCKSATMTDVKSPLCISEWCGTRSTNPEYKGYCYHCFVNIFPDHTLSRNYKTKEREVGKYIKDKFDEYELIFDKIIDKGCSWRKPDIFLDLLSHIIICEIDENQHKHSGYDSICENKRIMELSQDLAHRPIVFLRFNPDGYVDENGKKILSPWKKHSKGIGIVKESKDDWDNRLNTLGERFQYWIDNIPEKTVTIEKLFFTEGC